MVPVPSYKRVVTCASNVHIVSTSLANGRTDAFPVLPIPQRTKWVPSCRQSVYVSESVLVSVGCINKNFNLGHNFHIIKDRTYIFVFLMTRPFTWYHNFLPSDLDLEIWPTFENIRFGYKFQTRSDRAFILHMCIPCDKTFHMVLP